jgi:hypothetical protein
LRVFGTFDLYGGRPYTAIENSLRLLWKVVESPKKKVEVSGKSNNLKLGLGCENWI